MQQSMGLILVLVAGYFLLKNAGGTGGGAIAAGVRFTNSAGQAITSAVCGDVIGFEVDGFSEVWLVQMKDGAPQFDGAYTTPMAGYVLRCNDDVGVYQAVAYQRVSSGRGPLIGSATLTVRAADTAGGGSGGQEFILGPGMNPNDYPDAAAAELT